METCIIEELLKTSFSNKSFQDKLAIIKNGRPLPKLPNLSTLYTDKNRSFTRHFTEANYEKTVWLTGCSNMNKLFCWPCLLFSTEKSVWSSGGFCDLNNLCKAVGKHEKSKAHITCFFKLQTFGDSSSRIDLQLDHQRALEITRHNEQVKKNRYILSCLINAVCFLAKQELAFRGHTETELSFNKGNYVELLNYTSEYDAQLNEHLKNSTVFRGTSPQIQNDLINAISSVLNEFIRDEINKAEFVSILLDETSDVSNKSQLSKCFRYVDHEGNVKERFLGFSDVSADKTSEALFQLVDQTISEYKISNKIIGQTYDGAPVMSGGVGGLQTKIREKYPEALFVHCYSHALNLVLQQSVRNVKECSNFFNKLSGISSFFCKSPKRTNALSSFMNKKLPRLAPTRWNFSSRLVNTVKEYRTHLIEYFENITENSEEWDSESVLLASGCATFLNSFQACFLLHVFSSIFSHTDILFDVLQNKAFDIAYCCGKIESVKNIIKEKRLNSFDEFWKTALESSSEHPKKRRNEDSEIYYKRVFYEIFDNILSQINDRFGNYENLKFKALLDTQKFSQMKEKFPENEFNFLLKNYNRHFDAVRLKNELIVLYSTPDCELCSKPLQFMIKYMNEKKLNLVMPEVHKLLRLILTIPATTATVERSFSTLKRIKNFCRASQTQDRLSGLSLISIEKELLNKLRENPGFKFSETVIEKFCMQTRRMEFLFK